MGLWVLLLISKLTLMLQVVMQGNLSGLKPTMNLLSLSTFRKTFLFPFKLKKDLVLLSNFLKISFKHLFSHNTRDFQTPLLSSWDTNETSCVITDVAIAYSCNDVRQIAC